MREKTFPVTFRVNAARLALIDSKAKAAGVTRGEYLARFFAALHPIQGKIETAARLPKPNRLSMAKTQACPSCHSLNGVHAKGCKLS